MKREIEKELLKWKNSSERSPLIVRGARQVGKSYTVESFGQTNFKNTVVANFEEKPYLASCFDSLEIPVILGKLSNLLGSPIIPGESLLFLDEIQNCLPALKSLRYFKEKLPSLHVIAAGSFLEFVLEDAPDISFPVGRVQFINLRPLSFMEYLQAINQQGLCEIISSTSFENPLPDDLHRHLLRFVRDFFIIGGMPGAVAKFAQDQSYIDAQRIQGSIIEFYRLDLAKYSKKNQYKYLEYLFQRIPALTGQHFKYNKIDPHSSNPTRDYKTALHKLSLARVIHLVHATNANGIPLQSEVNEKKFKVFFLDIGLLQNALEVDAKEIATSELTDIFRGVLAEQFVGQELLAYVDPYIDRHLYFWDRQEAGGSAEVDFVMNISGKIVPIEVKSGATGKLKSLRQFLATKPAKTGLKISEAPMKREDNVLSIPFYLISQLPRLLE